MVRLIKVTGLFIGSLLLLLAIGFIVLVTFVSPDRFKPVLIEQVKKYTGRELTMDGHLSWTFYPYLGLKIGHAALNNPTGFKQPVFVEFSHATVSVKLIPLFHGQIISKGVALHGMKLNLIKNAAGKTNWAFQTAASSQVTPKQEKASITNEKIMPIGIVISAMDITDANVMWVNEQTNQVAEIQNFSFNAEKINLTEPVPIQAKFDFSLKDKDTTKGHITIQSKVAFSIDKQVYSLRDFNLDAEIQQDGKVFNPHLTGDMIADLSKQNFDISGVMKMQQLQVAKLNLSDINADIHYLNGLLNLNPITAKLYTGNLNAHVKVNLNTPQPQISLQGKLSHIQSDALLKDLSESTPKIKIIGLANMDCNLTTLGKTNAAIFQNLDGTARLSFDNGVLEGVDIGYLIDTAYALVSQKASAGSNSNKTSFGNLTATAVIHNGIMTNNDLLLRSPRFDTKGAGTINLNDQTIDYSLETSVIQTQINVVKELAGIAIPVRITGALKDPSIRLDTEKLLKQIAQHQLLQRKDDIENKIKEKLPEQAGQLLQNLLGR